MHVNLTQNQLFIYIRERCFIGLKMKCKCIEKFSIVCLASADPDRWEGGVVGGRRVGGGREEKLDSNVLVSSIKSLYLYFQCTSVFHFWSRRAFSMETADYEKIKNIEVVPISKMIHFDQWIRRLFTPDVEQTQKI